MGLDAGSQTVPGNQTAMRGAAVTLTWRSLNAGTAVWDGWGKLVKYLVDQVHCTLYFFLMTYYVLISLHV